MGTLGTTPEKPAAGGKPGKSLLSGAGLAEGRESFHKIRDFLCKPSPPAREAGMPRMQCLLA